MQTLILINTAYSFFQQEVSVSRVIYMIECSARWCKRHPHRESHLSARLLHLSDHSFLQIKRDTIPSYMALVL